MSIQFDFFFSFFCEKALSSNVVLNYRRNGKVKVVERNKCKNYQSF